MESAFLRMWDVPRSLIFCNSCIVMLLGICCIYLSNPFFISPRASVTCELCLFVFNQNCIPCCILLLLRSRVPFHASFQRFERDFEGVFLFYFRWGFWRKRSNWSDSLIIEDLDFPYTRTIRIAVSSWFSFLGLKADEVVFYPSIEQVILFERWATRASQDRARKWHARATPSRPSSVSFWCSLACLLRRSMFVS